MPRWRGTSSPSGARASSPPRSGCSTPRRSPSSRCASRSGSPASFPIVLIMQPRWPAPGRELGHVVVAGLLMHAVHLGGSHYTQYLGVSAGITALILSAQPLITALIAVRWMGETLAARQWAGVAIGLAGVALIVWHKVDVREATAREPRRGHGVARGRDGRHPLPARVLPARGPAQRGGRAVRRHHRRCWRRSHGHSRTCAVRLVVGSWPARSCSS